MNFIPVLMSPVSELVWVWTLGLDFCLVWFDWNRLGTSSPASPSSGFTRRPHSSKLPWLHGINQVVVVVVVIWKPRVP